MRVLSAKFFAHFRVLLQYLDRTVDQIREIDDAFGPKPQLIVRVDARNLRRLVGTQHRFVVGTRSGAHSLGRCGVGRRIEHLVLGSGDGAHDVA